MTPNTPAYQDLVDGLGDLLVPCLAQDWPNLPVERAAGSCLFGPDGRRYLDFIAGFGVCNAGHNHPRIVAAAREQMERMVHAPAGVIAHEPMLRLAWELAKVAPGGADMFFFGNSGAESIETALKGARFLTGRPGIVAFLGSFHGRTMGATSVTSSKASYRRGHGPLLPQVHFARYADPYRAASPTDCAAEALEDLDRLFAHVIPPEEVAALLVEPVLGEGGYVVPPREWLAGLRRRCDQHGILLVFDEVQSGFGRTGEWFAAQALDVAPDIVCLAKAIANGFPLGATGARRDLLEGWGAASHGTTFGGHPVSCAAALATLEVMREEGLPDKARSQGGYLLERLRELQQKHEFIGDVRGLGLMIGVEFVTPGGGREPAPGVARRVLDRALADGLLLYPCGRLGQVIRLSPPLSVTRPEIDEALDILGRALAAEEA
jgi:4-aminobutyrate aminotransferase